MMQPERFQAEAEAEEPGIFDVEDAEWEARCDAEAEADIAAARTVPHEDVAKWLETWGKQPRTPMPKRG